MEDPENWATGKARWIQELATFPYTWLQIVLHPVGFLRGATNGDETSTDITKPLVFWTLNTVLLLVLLNCTGDAQPGEISTALAVLAKSTSFLKVVAGTALLWFTITALFLSWTKSQKWLVANVICYSSVFYLPLSLANRWVSAWVNWQSLILFCRSFIGGRSFSSYPLFPWQLLVGALGLILLIGLWSIFIAKGLAIIGGKPRLRRRCYSAPVLAIIVVGILNVSFLAFSAVRSLGPLWEAMRGLDGVGTIPEVDNLTGYQNLERICRLISRQNTFTTSERYNTLRIGIIAGVASEEAMMGVSREKDSFACELWRERLNPDQFESVLAAWVARKRGWSEIDDRTGRTSQWMGDLKTLRSLRKEPGFRKPRKGDTWGLTVFTFVDAPLQLWPTTAVDYHKYGVWVTEERGRNRIGTIWFTDSNPFDSDDQEIH